MFKARSIISSWNQPDNSLNIDDLRKKSQQNPVLIFKHSTRCGTSHAIKSHLEDDYDQYLSDLDFYYVDLIKYRPLSDNIADELNVQHQSPQVILLMNGEVVYHTSHQAINAEKIKIEVEKRNS